MLKVKLTLILVLGILPSVIVGLLVNIESALLIFMGFLVGFSPGLLR